MTQENNISTRVDLKIAIIVTGMRQRDLAARASTKLGQGVSISELDFSKFVIGRTRPTIQQASAIVEVLDRPVSYLFPDLTKGGDQ